MTPKTIVNYKILKELGTGGMGTVYLAENISIGNRVAIKMLHPHLVKSKNIQARFLKEAKTQANLNHPNITKVIDFVNNEQGLFIILEFLEGEPLNDFLFKTKGLLPEKEANQYMAKILDAVAYAHSKNVVHRDLKSANIMVTPNKGIKIMDFGIAKLANETLSLTKTGSRLGSPLYMSPEQVTNGEVDYRSDIYSLGVVYHEMLTGTPVYDQNTTTEFEIYNRIVKQPLPRLKEFYKMNSDHAQEIVDTATAKLPVARFQSCSEFKAALPLNGTAGKSHYVPPSSPAPIKKRHAQKPRPHNQQKEGNNNNAVWIIAILLALLLLGGGGYYFSQNNGIGKSTIIADEKANLANEAYSADDYKKAFELYSQVEPKTTSIEEKLNEIQKESDAFEKEKITSILQPYLSEASFLNYDPTNEAQLETLLTKFPSIETEFLILQGEKQLVGEGKLLPQEKMAMNTLKTYYVAKKTFENKNYRLADSLLSNSKILNTSYISNLQDAIAEKLGNIEAIAYDEADIPPKFPECNEKNANRQKKCFERQLNRYIFQNIDAKSYSGIGLNGYKSFGYYIEIASNGNLGNITVRSPHPKLDYDILRVLKNIQKIIPGQENGVAAKISFVGEISGNFGEQPTKEVINKVKSKDTPPLFPSCNSEDTAAQIEACFREKLKQHLDNDAAGESGTIYFSINKNGAVYKSKDWSNNSQIKDALKDLPKMEPAKLNGESIIVTYNGEYKDGNLTLNYIRLE